MLGGWAIEVSATISESWTLGSMRYKVSASTKATPEFHIWATPNNCPVATLSSPDAFLISDVTLDKALAEHHYDYYLSAYSTCPVRPPLTTSINLNLLLVCRAVYAEAALLPFKKNKFIMHTGPRCLLQTFQRLLDRFAREQRCALAHLTVTSAANFFGGNNFNKCQLLRLRGLRTLHIIQEPNPHLKGMYDAISSGWKHAGGLPRTLIDGLTRLESVRFSVDVHFTRNFPTTDTQRAIVRAQTPRLKKMLGLVEARLFGSLTGRAMRVAVGEEYEEDGVCFEEHLRVVRRFE